MNRNAGQLEDRSPAVGQRRPYRLSHDFTGPAELTATLAHALSDMTGMNVTDAELAVHEQVDTRALDRLFAPGTGTGSRVDGRLTFPLCGYRVTVHGTGEIAIAPPQQGYRR